jgi:hypothetical protein
MDTMDLSSRTSRRTVVKTGVKLAYAVPLVAASFKLTASGALAAVCPPGYERVEEEGGPNCCRCRVLSGDLQVIDGVAVCVIDGESFEADCTGLVASI